jgi:hypothetical protein
MVTEVVEILPVPDLKFSDRTKEKDNGKISKGSAREFPGITKLTRWEEALRVRARGDWATDKLIEGSLTFQNTSPADLRSTVPTTLSLEEGLILIVSEAPRVLPTTLSFSSGDSAAKRIKSNETSQNRRSVEFDDLPRSTSLNWSPSEDELGEIEIWEGEEGRGEMARNLSQLDWKDGEIRRQLHSKSILPAPALLMSSVSTSSS